MSHFRHGIACFGNVSSSRLENRHCLIFFFACAASYDEARRKLDKSQYTSDLASEDEPPQKRRRTPATRWDPTDDTCSSLWSEDSAGTLPPEVPTDFPQGETA